jgi:cytidine deaminase
MSGESTHLDSVPSDGPQPTDVGALSAEVPAQSDASPPGGGPSPAASGIPSPAASSPAAAVDWPALLTAAREVRLRAHAPYSRFAVGAAVLDERGRVHAGCNVENAAYPQGWCAETSALAAMVSSGGRQVRAVVVVGEAAEPVTPCGGCRQKLREFAADDCPVVCADTVRQRARYTLGQLLPASFGPAHLGPQVDADGVQSAGAASARSGDDPR